MRLLVILLTTLLFQDIPFKGKDEFELKFDLQFKMRPANPDVAYTTNRQTGSTPLPYLTIDLTVTKILEDESKVKVLDMSDRTLQALNLEKKNTLRLDLGFADDLKDQVSSHIYTVNFYSEEKQLKRKIIIEFQKDGSYLVNGEKRGRI